MESKHFRSINLQELEARQRLLIVVKNKLELMEKNSSNFNPQKFSDVLKQIRDLEQEIQALRDEVILPPDREVNLEHGIQALQQFVEKLPDEPIQSPLDVAVKLAKK